MSRIFDLRCMNEIYPVNIIDDVYFSFKIKPGERLIKSVLTIFDGDKVLYQKEDDTKTLIIYATLKIEPLKEYMYTLKGVFDDGEETLEGKFRGGLVNGFDIGAKWISNGAHFVSLEKTIGNKALYFSRDFHLDKLPSFAVIHIVGVGFYELYINGKKVSDRVLEPGYTEYDKRVLYSSYDILEYLKEGENKIKVIVGDGWYNQTALDTWGFYYASWRDNAKLLFELDYDDKKIFSDDKCKVSYGVIISNCVRVGEKIDFNNIDGEKYNVVVCQGPGGLLVPSYLPPIRECEEYQVVSKQVRENDVIFDFGVNFVGYAEIVFEGEKGESIKIEYAERLRDGELDNKNNKQYIFNEGLEYQVDECVLSGGIDVYKPKFVYHGFRYARVIGKVKIHSIKGYFVHTDLEKRGDFRCSDDTLNTLYNMTIRSILSNYHSIPTDCPHREKNGWTGDANLSLNTAVYTFDMHEAYKKWVMDIVASQRPNGQIPGIAPSPGWGYNWGWGPAWDIAFYRATHAIYYYYNDISFVEKVYPYLLKHYEFTRGFEIDGLNATGLGDWCIPRNITFKVCSTELTSSAFVMLMNKVLIDLSKALGKDSSRFEEDYARIKKAIYEKYRDDDTLTGMATLTAMDIVDRTEDIKKYLEEYDYSCHFGILGNKFLLETLGRKGMVEEGYKILTRKEYPSFRYWILNGMTTLGEDFEMKWSRNHHMFSPISEFMIRWIGGVEIKKDGDILVNPNLPKEVSSVEVKVATMKGEFLVKANRENGGVAVSIEVI